MNAESDIRKSKYGKYGFQNLKPENYPYVPTVKLDFSIGKLLLSIATSKNTMDIMGDDGK